MSNIQPRPLTEEQYDLVESLEQLPISGTNQGIAKVGSNSFANKEFDSSSTVAGNAYSWFIN